MIFLGALLLFLTLGAQANSLRSLSQRSVALYALQAAFPSDQIVLEGTAAYGEINGDYLSRVNSDIEPNAIFLPISSEDVAKFVKIVSPFTLVGGSKVRVAVRGGGQQPAPACNNIEDGFTIDLRNLSSIAVNSGAGQVAIGAGVRWASVYKKLEPLGLGVAGGRAGTNGIGGLALAGGLSFFSSREGFISDNVLSYEVVLASGKIVTASAKENKDLYKALRGGGNNFGIVTRYTFRTFAQGPFWGGSVFYFPASFPDQIDSLVKEIKKPNADPDTHLMISTAYSSQFAALGGDLCLNQIYYTKPVENPPVVQPFTNIEPQIDALSTLRNVTIVSAAGEQTEQTAASQRIAYMNLHIKADAATLRHAAELYTSNIGPLKGLSGITASLTLQPYPVSLLEHVDFQGGNVLGLGPSDGPIVSVLFLTYWDNASDDTIVISTLRSILEHIKTDASSRGTLIPYEYMNYAHDFQDPITSYGAANKKFLQTTSKKYDPLGFFQKAVPGGFKLWR